MAGAFFFSVGTIGLSTREGRKPSTLLKAASHNRRQIQAELGARSHIDSTRTRLNETIAGPDTPAGVVALALALMTGAGVVPDKLRKDHAQAVELLFSLAPDTTVNTGEYFRGCANWVGEQFGSVNILSADIHRDEAAPHLHILVLPLVAGRMCGSVLITRPRLAKLRTAFAHDVAQKFGLKAPPGRMAGAMRGQAVRLVLERLESTRDAILNSALWQCTRQAIERDPAPYVSALGIELSAAPSGHKPKTMAQIFTSPGKGPKVEARLKPIGFEITTDGTAPKHRNLSCVGFAQNKRLNRPRKWSVNQFAGAFNPAQGIYRRMTARPVHLATN